MIHPVVAFATEIRFATLHRILLLYSTFMTEAFKLTEEPLSQHQTPQARYRQDRIEQSDNT